ncbi:dihydrodipicolinate synthase family protein [Pseudomonas syringae pv. syringae]|uniref:dihydrodipicolinate synthase family protein n=1 Tax=Pseudomonas TaxID=286 RepID=UPI001CE24B3B|nr:MULTISPECIES: dihydrodipicolinate synthase family protein [Pseudomonas]MCA5967991.1 dihydrodipicolinate synthase family protein [Pseudomonas sp. P129]MEE1991745.1 dihydrodipicolinate synthase family protein [Pseudomonas syringae pv. syringae]MEE1996800.1 dihydrodipicolinate synthase family protein [Pseudomonas syringae pv. syringae]
MKIEGSFVALITPFGADGSVDFGAFKALIEWQQHHGTRFLLFMSTTGEVSMLSPEEREDIVINTMAMKPSNMFFFYGCTGSNTDTTIKNVSFAAKNGADGGVISVPPYVSPSVNDAERYFLDVADSTTLPLGTYNNSPRLGTDMHWEQLLRIFEHPNYVVHKEATGRAEQMARLLRAKPDISLMCDDLVEPGLLIHNMSLGGQGVLSAIGNLIPKEIELLATPWHDARQSVIFKETYLEIMPLLEFAYSATAPTVTKTMMNAVGLPAGSLRKPLRPIEQAHLNKGLNILKGLGLDKKYKFML